MKAVYMLMHQQKPNIEEIAYRVCHAFRQAGISVSVEPWLESLSVGSGLRFDKRCASNCDAVVAVGGDGTLLRANLVALSCHLPVFGINVGRVGFLTEIELDQIEEACQALAADRYTIERRMMLEARIGSKQMLALNDVVVTRGGYSRLITLNAWMKDDLVGRFTADGLIVSTPTGSTGYSLSAGGPIICPEVECMLITPVCAHSLQHRPVVTSASGPVRIHLEEGFAAQVSIDGQPPFSISDQDELCITRSEHYACFIRFEPKSFFSKIRYKLSEWSC